MSTATTRSKPAATSRRGGPGAADARAHNGSSRVGAKLAATVAERIVDDIVAAGWPEGVVLGSEADLLQRHGVSRAVLREAIRIVELQQVARMRRGPGGGLVVANASVDYVIDAASVYLYFVQARVDEVFEARMALESAAAAVAPERLDEQHLAAMRTLVQREREGQVTDYREFHRLVAAISGNPAIDFFVDLLNRVTFLYLPPRSRLSPATIEASALAHAAIAGAILSGDGGLARKRMRKHLEAESSFLRRRRSATSSMAELPTLGRGEKLPEVTARAIFREVAAAGWPVGDLIGSEAELMDRHGVSRAVLREAVRLLEHHGIARMRRGPGGGLFVTEPDAAATTEAVALYVERNGITRRQLFEVRTAVEMAVLDRVMGAETRLAPRLEEALAAEQSASPEEFVKVGHDLHDVLAELGGNRVLELLTAVLVRLSRLRSAAPADAPDPFPTGDVTRAHRGIVDAIVAGDPELARHRAHRHLDALEEWVR